MLAAWFVWWYAFDCSRHIDRQQQGCEFIAYHLSPSAVECDVDPGRKILQVAVCCCSNFSAEKTR